MERAEQLALLRVHLRVIDDDVAPVIVRYREHIECRAGCGDCCRQTFRVSALEGALLREALAALPAEACDAILARAKTYRPDTRTPCPALDDDARCQLYDARPRLCRKYGIPLWHPDRPHEVTTCTLNFRGVTDIDAAMILEPQAEWARAWIRLREATGQRHGDVATIAEHLLEDAP